ncbi:MAG: HD domain-containing protein [Candidatus Micrarchaeota archaeon]
MIIKDEIYGTIGFDEFEERIIDTPEFQRLRRVKQMSVTNLVYPGANHTRFEHSLGTAHLSETIGRRLGLDSEALKKLKLYALLHDIGHVAFSHEGEDVLKKHIGDHEKIGKEKILGGEIADVLSENYRPSEIIKVGESKEGSIVSSDIGADRMDYLKRDARNTGVAYGIIDIDRIVHMLSMEKGELCIWKGGLEAAEYLLIARFMMFSTVYLHHTVRIGTALLYRAIEESVSDGSVKAIEFATLGDDEAMVRMKGSRNGRRYVDALLERRLYKEVCSFQKTGKKESAIRKLGGELTEKFGHEIIVDYPHPFFKPIEFQVKTEGGLVPIGRLSTIMSSLKESEGQRMRVLVLADQRTKEKEGARIRKELSGYL